MRASSLDELPELVNILKGDMSIIGPRPLMARYLDYYTDYERKRHNVRPGLSGYAQVHGRNNVNWDERMKMDAYYAEHISLAWIKNTNRHIYNCTKKRRNWRRRYD